jgi:hypothetical protein
MKWSWEDYENAPSDIVEGILLIMEAEAEHAKAQAAAH